MSKRIWHKGLPPHVGWWEASYFRQKKIWRWCDGITWSSAVDIDSPAKNAAVASGVLAGYQECISWTDYYPKNARVPRINPNKVKP